MEQLTCQSARQGSQLHRIQKKTENIHASNGLRRIVTFLIIAPYKYSYLLTYLLTYLLSDPQATVKRFGKSADDPDSDHNVFDYRADSAETGVLA